MVYVTIRITAQPGAGETDFDVRLIEENGTETVGVLRRADLTTGRWTANVGRVLPPPAKDKDIVSHVAGVTPDRRSHPDYDDIAKALYEWLLPAGALRQRWGQLANPRVYVETSVDALERLPWEMACPATPPRQRPALIGGLCRLTPRDDHRVPAPATNRRSTWPFRILIVIGCAENEEDGLSIGKEVDAIERTFHPLGRTVDVHCMRRPTHAQMMKWIEHFQPHVFHFAGHGIKVAGADQYGLRIENAALAWTWSSDDIDVDLPRVRWVPTFVFLNACRSAAEQNGSWSTQRSFMSAGAKAVLGMQADIGGSVAGDFAAAMYKGLAAGANLEDAMNQARAAIPGARQDIGWALPAMTVSERNARLFVPQPLPADESYEKCAEFEDARLFANCREPRRDFTNWACPCVTTPDPEKNVLLVLGEQNSGKSHLVKWCMENWVIGGARVRYIKVHDGTAKTFLSVLRQIRDGEADDHDIKTHYLHAGLPKPAFRKFNWHLNNLIRTGAPGEWIEAEHPEAEIPDQYQPLTALSEKQPQEEIGAFFLEALRSAAGEKPLVLVFDQLESSEGGRERLLPVDEFEQLVRRLFLPIAAAPSSLVKIAIVATNAQAAAFGLAPTPAGYADRVARYELPIKVTDDELAALAVEMMWFKDEKWIKELATILLLRRQTRIPTPQGLARLLVVRNAIKDSFPDYYNAVERMR
jgi:CHAT domain